MKIGFSNKDELPSFPNLDENGFPISSSTEEVSRGEEIEGRTSLLVDDLCSTTSAFALDFYLAGVDWSHLGRDEDLQNGEEKKKTLVQQDLFDAWGIKTPSKRPGLRIHSPPRKRHHVLTGNCSAGGASISGRNDMSNGPDRPRSCPFYKKIPGTFFTIDAFRYGAITGCSAYFLSHFHYDHYGGLDKRWSHGKIYCTNITARLLKICLAVNPQYICPLELNSEHVIEDINVTLLEANHCPGAALILFRLKNGKCYLHTGDFRASKSMQHYPLLSNQHINLLYLDTTYCNPKYSFPPKEDVLAFVVKATLKFLPEQPKSLVVVGAYSIGKEPVYLAISQALGVPVYANASRRNILQSFGWPELSGRLCSCPESSPLHVLPISQLRHENLKEYLKTCKQQFKAVLAFRPTGVPYSEHSSFTELREFVKFLKPEKIIPTVNSGSAESRAKMQSYFSEWLNE